MNKTQIFTSGSVLACIIGFVFLAWGLMSNANLLFILAIVCFVAGAACSGLSVYTLKTTVADA